MSEVLDCDVVIHGGVVLTVDAEDRVIGDGAVAVTGTRIVAVGPSAEVRGRYRGRTTIDAQGAVVHPGFIDAHIHVSQYSSRSVLPRMGDGPVSMGDWKAALTPEDEHASAALAAIDYLRSGYTGFVDPGTIFEPDAVAAVAAEIGIRVWLTDPYVADLAHVLAEHEPELVSGGFLARWPKTTEEALARMGSQLHRNRDADGLVHAFIGLYGAGTASPALHQAGLEAARRNGVQFQEHRGYNPRSYLEEEAARGGSTVAALAAGGVLGPDVTFIHMNVVHAEDVEPLRASDTRLVWCPYSQLRAIGGGMAEPRMPQLVRAGLSVGLATDIPRTVSFDALGGLATGNAAACGASLHSAEVLRLRTIGAAATVGAAEDVGSIEVGKRADIVVRAPSASEALGVDPAWEIAVLGVTEPPALTLINGVPVVRNGALLTSDPAEAVRSARRSAEGILKRIGLSA